MSLRERARVQNGFGGGEMNMREIKFRVWDPNNDTMYTNVGIGQISLYDFDGDRITEQDGLIIMQYTGHKDHTGAEIYEGDIVFADSNEYNYVIKFGEYPNDHDEDYKCTGWYTELVGDGYKCSLQMTEGLEIIGNIYANPDLLPKAPDSTESA